MASLFTSQKYQVIGTNGPIVGAQIYTYAAGTLTPLSTYTDQAGLSPNTNPIITGADGRASIWLGTGAYRFRVYDSVANGGALLDDVDNITTPQQIAAALDTILRADLGSTVDAAKGAAIVGFLQAGANAVGRSSQAKLRERITAGDFGTTADLFTALSRVKASFPDSNRTHIQAGTWQMTTGITYTSDRLNFEGDGRWASLVNFSPAAAATAFTFNNPAAGGFNQGSFKGIAFTSSNSIAKTAISLVNCANFTIEEVAMNGAWAGDSIGVRSAGRQFVTLRMCELACARPVVVSPNVTWPALATDHFLIDDCELTGQSATRPVVEIETGVSFSNWTMRQVAIVGGQHGVYYNDTTSTAASFKILIDGLRSEQGMDPAGYGIYFASTAQQIQSLTIRNTYLGGERHGIFLRNCQRVIIEGYDYVGGAGKTAIDMTFVAGSKLTMINCFSQAGSARTFTNAKCVRRENTTALGFIEEWVYDSGPVAGAEASDVYHGGFPVVVANAGVTPVADANFTGFLMVSTSQDNSAIYLCRGGTSTVAEVSDVDAVFSVTAGTASSTNIYWDGGTSRYVLQNNRGLSLSYSVYKIGTTI